MSNKSCPISTLKDYITHQNAPESVCKIPLPPNSPRTWALTFEQLELVSEYETCPLFRDAVAHQLKVRNMTLGELIGEAIKLRKSAYRNRCSIEEYLLNNPTVQVEVKKISKQHLKLLS